MKTPWTPFEQGNGERPPTLAERIFVGADGQPKYGTAANPIERKAFMNLPMPTKDAMNIYDPKLFKGPKKGTGLRHGQRALEGAGENYVDSFVTHPVAGNYEKLFADLDDQAKRKEPDQAPALTLEMIARQGYTNMGLNADEERMNSMRDKLRFMGASDEEIETQLKEARQQRIRELAGREMIPEQRELEASASWARQMGVHPDQGDFNFGVRPPFDANVFNFGIPRPSSYAGHQTREGPNNGVFVPQGARGIRGSGVHHIEVIDGNVEAQELEAKSHGALQLALSSHAPELVSRTAGQVKAHAAFVLSARRIYDANMSILKKQKEDAEKALREAATYKAKRYPTQKLKEIRDKIQDQGSILGAIEAGHHAKVLSALRGRGRPRK